MRKPNLSPAPITSAQPRRGTKPGWLFAGGLLLLAAFTLFGGLGGLPLVGPDEPRYAEVAREMWATGDYVSPRLCGLLWFEKPVLFYWAAASSYHLWGVNELGARFPSALAALVCVLALWGVLARARMENTGRSAALVLASMGLWIYFAHGASTDMLLAATITLALLAGYRALGSVGRARWLFALGCAFSTALAMLAKGPIGIFLVVAVLALYCLFTRRSMLRGLARNPLLALASLVLFSVVTMLWYGPVTARHGSVFIQEFFVNHNFKRFLTNRFNHPQPPWFYLLIVIAGSVPWTFLLLPAGERLRRLRFKARGSEDELLLFAWLWFLLPIAFFSISKSKLPGYILPSFPALAILVGSEIERLRGPQASQTGRVAVLLTAGLLFIAGAGATIYLLRGHFASGALIALTLLPLGGGIVAAWLLARPKTPSRVFSEPQRSEPWIAPVGAGVMGTLALCAVTLLFPHLGPTLSLKPLSLRVADALRPDERVIFYRKVRNYAPVFYTKGRVDFFRDGVQTKGLSTGDDIDLQSPAELLTALKLRRAAGSRGAILITSPQAADELRADTRFNTQTLSTQAKPAAEALRVSLRAG